MRPVCVTIIGYFQKIKGYGEGIVRRPEGNVQSGWVTSGSVGIREGFEGSRSQGFKWNANRLWSWEAGRVEGWWAYEL